ncbi:hypothetical protein [Thiothrix eikelboomii]|uniref:hypothetical protein n=1 Tax=Thiothrix eikelboomii TaxID=92487 RepID=UPI003BAE26CA
MINQFPMIPVFNERKHIKDGFFSCESIVENKENSVFSLELIGTEKLIDDYINNLIIIDIKLSYIEDKVFDRLIESKKLKESTSFEENVLSYKCQGLDMDSSKFSELLGRAYLNDDGNYFHENILNINLILLKESVDWNFFYFEIDPPISQGNTHAYRQRFSNGRGYIDMDISGGQCCLSVNSTSYGYFTKSNDCRPIEWGASSNKYQRANISSNKDGSDYTISGGWQRIAQEQ